MPNIERHESGLVGYKPLSEKFISDRVAALWASCKTYGKPCDGALFQGWSLVIKLKKITADEFNAGVEFFLLNAKEMPMPGEFAQWIQERRDEDTLRRRMEETQAEIRREDQERDREIAQKYSGMDLPELRKHAISIFDRVEEAASERYEEVRKIKIPQVVSEIQPKTPEELKRIEDLKAGLLS